MSYSTRNPNVYPYYDDFDESKRFLRVLFKPGRAIQGRELTQLQTLLQYQMKNFGNHIFQDNTVVAGANLSNITCNYLRIHPVSMTGSTSFEAGVFEDTYIYRTDSDGDIILDATDDNYYKARVVHTESKTDDDPYHLLFIKGFGGSAGITYGDQFKSLGATVASTNTILLGVPTAGDSVITDYDEFVGTTGITGYGVVGDARVFGIAPGLFFVDGHFVQNTQQKIAVAVEKTGGTKTLRTFRNPNTTIGFDITHNVVDSSDDSSLLDPASGASNFAAPGADRYRMDLTLTRKNLDVYAGDNVGSVDYTLVSSKDYFDIIRFKLGLPQNRLLYTKYSELEKSLARRTFNESGHYVVEGFIPEPREHLRDDGGTQGSPIGAFTSAQGGRDDLFIVEISPGVAYIDGFEQVSSETLLLPVEKARDAEHQRSVDNDDIIPNMGAHVFVEGKGQTFGSGGTIKLNPSSFPVVGLVGNQGTGFDGLGTTAAQIGKARVRGFQHLSDGNQALFLSDIQMGVTTTGTYPFYLVDSIHGFTGSGVTAIDGTVLGGTGMDLQTAGATIGGNFQLGPKFFDITAAGKTLGAGLTSGMLGTVIQEPANTTMILATTNEVVKDFSRLTYNLRRTLEITATGNGSITFGKSDLFPVDVPTDKFNFARTSGTPSTDELQIYDITEGKFLSQSGISIALDVNNTDGSSITVSHSSIANSDKLLVFVTCKLQDGGENQDGLSLFARKTLVTGATGEFVTTLNPESGLFELSLNLSDVYAIKGVSAGGLSGGELTGGLTGDEDVTSLFYFDNGQRETHYDHAKLIARPNSGVTGGETYAVEFDHFTHSNHPFPFIGGQNSSYDAGPSGSVGFKGIPNYLSPSGFREPINLGDAIDFRPVRQANSETFSDYILPFHATSNTQAMDLTYTHYMGRFDKVYLRSDETVATVKGIPDVTRDVPGDPEDGVVIAVLDIQPFTFDASDMQYRIVENRRYTMRDIGIIEQRIARLEYYTSLSLLELKATDAEIVDSNGLIRFKNGIFVEPCEGHNFGDVRNPDYNILMDDFKTTMECPQEFQILEYDLGKTAGVEITDENVAILQRTGSEIISGMEQTVRSRKISVNPFNVVNFAGRMDIEPRSDQWQDTTRQADIRKTVNIDATVGNANALAASAAVINVKGRGWPNQPTSASQFLNNWGKTFANLDRSRNSQSNYWNGVKYGELRGQSRIDDNFKRLSDQLGSSNVSLGRNKLGSATANIKTTEYSATTSTSYKTTSSDKIVGIGIVPFMRTKTIKFKAVGLKPNTKHYAFFDEVPVSAETTPGTSSTKKLSDVVSDGSAGGDLIPDETGTLYGLFTIPAGKFRTGQRGFKVTDNEDGEIQLESSAAFTVYSADGINVKRQRTFTTRATRRTVYKPRQGKITVPLGRATTSQDAAGRGRNHPKWGQLLSDVNGNIRAANNAYEKFVAQGHWKDPICQSILIGADEYPDGVCLDSVDIFFAAKDTSLPVSLQIVRMVDGFPDANDVIDFSKKTLQTDEVTVATDWSSGTPETKFKFDTPPHLEPGEYAIMLVSNSNLYEVWHSQMGDFALDIDGTVSENVVSEQPYAGSFFESQNASTWTPEQNKDLCFRVNKCVFDASASGVIDLKQKFLSIQEISAGWPHSVFGSTAGSGVATNRYFNSYHKIVPAMTSMEPNATSINHRIKTMTVDEIVQGGGLYDMDGNGWQGPGIPSETVETDIARQEINRKAIQLNNASLELGDDDFFSSIPYTLTLNTLNPDVTPYFETERMGVYLTQNLINNFTNIDTTSADYNGELEPVASKDVTKRPIARYMTKAIKLTDGLEARGLTVFLTQMKRPGSTIHVFARFNEEGSEKNIREQKFVQLLPTDSVRSNSDSLDDQDFREVEYQLPDERDYGTFQIKVVLYTDPSQATSPVVADLRAIAVT